MKRVMLSLMILVMLCGISSAEFIYTTSEGDLGRIKLNSSSDIEVWPELYSGNLSSPFLASYWNGNSTSLMLVDRYAGVSGDKAYLFNPNSLTSYIQSRDIKNVYGTNASAYSENGYSVFLAAGSVIYELSSSTFRVLNSYDCTRIISNDTYSTEIVTLATNSQTIHALASAGDKQRYIRFDGQLKERVDDFISSDVSADATAMVVTANSYPIIAHSSGVNIMRSNKKFSRLISSDYPVKAICSDQGSGMFYAEQYQDGENYENRICHFGTFAEFTGLLIESSTPDITIIRDNEHKEMYAALTGGKIVIFMYTNDTVDVLANYHASDLGGSPVGIVTSTVSGYNANSSSSGCDSVYAGMILLALIPFVLRRK